MKQRQIRQLKLTFFLFLIALFLIFPRQSSAKSVAEIIEDSTAWQINIANDDTHGYVNNNAQLFYGQEGDYNCVGLNVMGWVNAGLELDYTGFSVTKDMKDSYLNHGFEDVLATNEVNLTKKETLQRGDVLIRLSKVVGRKNYGSTHVAQYIGGQKMVEAGGGSIDGNSKDDTGDEIKVTTYRNDDWEYVLRYVGEEQKNIESEQSSQDGGSTVDMYPEFPTIEKEEFNCENIFYYQEESGEIKEKLIKKLLDGIFTIIKISVPVLAIALSTIDYIKTLAATESMNKANKRTIKRATIAIAIVFLPYLLEALFKIFGLYDLSSCKIG